MSGRVIACMWVLCTQASPELHRPTQLIAPGPYSSELQGKERQVKAKIPGAEHLKGKL